MWLKINLEYQHCLEVKTESSTKRVTDVFNFEWLIYTHTHTLNYKKCKQYLARHINNIDYIGSWDHVTKQSVKSL